MFLSPSDQHRYRRLRPISKVVLNAPDPCTAEPVQDEGPDARPPGDGCVYLVRARSPSFDSQDLASAARPVSS
jgi:hypothetical protein